MSMLIGQPARVLVVACLSLGLGAGCTHTFEGVPGSSPGSTPGSLTFQVPGRLPAAAHPPPPPPGQAAAAPDPRNGRYAGQGTLVFNPGRRDACRATIPITGFTVAGNMAAFGGSRDAIAPDGSLQIQAGQRWLTGRFVGTNFEGRLWQPPPSCTYSVSLIPAG